MFSEKELNLEETELRERVRMLSPPERTRYNELEQRLLKDPAVYLKLNVLFFTGAHHFYLRRWFRGVLNLVMTLAAVYLLVSPRDPWFGVLLLLAVIIIEIPQLMNARHLVHAYNNRMMHRCLRRAGTPRGSAAHI
jgi:TM2 domain-containing membrane protein YozV